MAPEVAAGFEWATGPAGLVLICRPLSAVAPHLFSTRDLRFRGASVATDRQRVAAAFGVAPGQLLAVSQVHGCRVAVVGGCADPSGDAEADAVMSTRHGSVATVVVADCVPILLGDRYGRAVVAVHAGWRGTAAGIVEEAVRALQTVGVAPADVIAAIGPSIGPCCYQVDAPVRQALAPRGQRADAWFAADGDAHWRLDLWTASADQLVEAGVSRQAIHVAAFCTAHHPDVCWSYRRDGAMTGRLVAAIALATMKGGRNDHA